MSRRSAKRAKRPDPPAPQPSGDVSAAIMLALFALAATATQLATATGRFLGIDEACYLGWALSGVPLGETSGGLAGFLGLKAIPVWMVGTISSILGPGYKTLLVMKGAFALFAPALALGLFAWRRAEGDAAPAAFVVAGLAASTPAILYGSGRLLSEVPALAFCAWGMAAFAASERRASRSRWTLWLLALAAFFGAYATRSTSFTTTGAFLGWRALRDACGGESGGEWRNGFATRLLRSRAVWLAVAFGALIALWSGLFAFPKFPLGYALATSADYQRPLHANVGAFALSMGALGPCAVALSLMAAFLRGWRREHAFAWAWLVAASSPYLLTMARGAELLPRHLANLAPPCVLLAAMSWAAAREKWSSAPNSKRAGAIVVAAIIAALWAVAYVGAGRWASAFTHGALESPSFLAPVVAACALLAFAAIGAAAWNRKKGAAIGLAIVALAGVSAAQVWGAYPAIRTDGSAVAPSDLRALFERAGVESGDVVLFAAPHYEGDSVRFVLPDIAWRTLDSSAKFAIRGDNPDGSAAWMLLSRLVLADDPGLGQRLLASNGARRKAELVGEAGLLVLYKVEAP